MPRRLSVLIAVTVGLQLIASSRILCPPHGWSAFRWLRVACAPQMWPFIDYPMFSAPHRRGEVLAWLDARVDTECGIVSSEEVQRAAPEETLDAAFTRVEQKMRGDLERASPARVQRVHFERHLCVFGTSGLEPVTAVAGCDNRR